MQHTLQSVLDAAHAGVQSGNGTIEAMQVWRQVSDAMEILKAQLQRGGV